MLVVDHRCFKAGALADRCEAAYRLCLPSSLSCGTPLRDVLQSFP